VPSQPKPKSIKHFNLVQKDQPLWIPCLSFQIYMAFAFRNFAMCNSL
jgi:hypothetical protein